MVNRNSTRVLWSPLEDVERVYSTAHNNNVKFMVAQVLRFWPAGCYPFGPTFRFQFEKAVVENQKGKLMIYEASGNVIDLSKESEGDTGDINLPKSNAYANEIRYFTDCVLADRFPDKVKPEELEAVIEILNKL